MTAPPAVARPGHGMSRGMVLVFALACGLSVANLYYAQPILHSIARTFSTSSGTTGLLVTFSQVGYAAGLALLVPLGDLVTRRRLIPVVLVVTAAALVASAAGPDLAVLEVTALLYGTGSVVAQILIPMAASLAEDSRRGQVVGTVMSGLLLGILLARTVSGLVAGLAGWRTVYAIAAALTLFLAALLRSVLPGETERPRIRYRSLLSTTVGLMAHERLLQARSVFGALGFAAFSLFWTTVAFMLSGPPYHYGDVTIGLFGLVGAGGALCANLAGRWADRGLTRVTTLVFAVCVAVSFLPLWYGRSSLTMLIVGILVLDVGVQGLQVTNQSMIYRLSPESRSRVTSAYMVCYFVGGAIGSAVAGTLYGSDGWAGVCVAGAVVGTAAVVGAVAGWGRGWSRQRSGRHAGEEATVAAGR